MPLLHVYERPLSGWGSTIKAVEDKILGLLILVVVAPLLLLIALLVKLDSPGPVLFRQKRYGFNNNDITIYKFRHHVSRRRGLCQCDGAAGEAQ